MEFVEKKPKMYVYNPGPQSLALSIAVDDALWSYFSKNSGMMLRVYNFDPEGVILGRGQNPKDFKVQEAYQDGYSVTRRHTGGTAVWGGSKNLNYAFFLNTAVLRCRPRKWHEVYCWFNEFIVQLIGLFGVNLEKHGYNRVLRVRDPQCFSSTGQCELTLEEQKVYGSAYFSNGIVYVQQGQLIVDEEENLKLLKYAKSHLRNEASLKKKLQGVSREELIDRLVTLLRRDFKTLEFDDFDILEKAKEMQCGFEVR